MASKQEKELTEFGLAYARAVGDDIQGLIGANVLFEDPAASEVERAELCGGGDPVAHTVCRTEDGSDAALHLVVPLPQAVALASLRKGIEKELIAEKQNEGLDEDLLDAFGEVMNLATAVLGRTLQEKGDLPALQAAGTRQIESPLEDEEWLAEGSYRLLRFRLVLPAGLGESRFDIAFPSETAEEWFGAWTASGSPEGGEAESDSEDGSAPTGETGAASEGDGPIVFVDASDDDRKQAESLEEALGRNIWSFAPEEFGDDAMGEVAEAAAIVIAWDLGGRSGIDLLETLLCDERTRDIPVLLASAEPTRAMVTAAISAGARSFIFKPYHGDELVARLR